MRKWRKEKLKGRSMRKSKNCLCLWREPVFSPTVPELTEQWFLKIFSRFADSFKNQIKAMELLSKKCMYLTLNVFIHFLGAWTSEVQLWVWSVHGPRLGISVIILHAMPCSNKWFGQCPPESSPIIQANFYNMILETGDLVWCEWVISMCVPSHLIYNTCKQVFFVSACPLV